MKKSTKGALAAGAAAVLLLGGGGSLAFWTASQTVAGTTLTAGELKLTAAANNCTEWRSGTTTITKFVPGDTITKDCTYTLVATGENLRGTLNVPNTVSLTPSAPNTSLKATVAASYTLGGAAVANNTFTSADNGKQLVARISVTFPFGDTTLGTAGTNANDIQTITAAVNALTVTATQTTPVAP